MNIPNVLIIEDDRELSLSLSEFLHYWGLQTEIIRDGQSALDWLHEHRPDAVILDMHLPRVSGLQILDYILSNERLANITVIVSTADENLAHQVGGRARFVLVKPFALEQFEDIVKTLL